jgi:hypothetical protein
MVAVLLLILSGRSSYYSTLAHAREVVSAHSPDNRSEVGYRHFAEQLWEAADEVDALSLRPTTVVWSVVDPPSPILEPGYARGRADRFWRLADELYGYQPRPASR